MKRRSLFKYCLSLPLFGFFNRKAKASPFESKLYLPIYFPHDDFSTKTYKGKTFWVWRRCWHDGHYDTGRFGLEMPGGPGYAYGVFRTITRKDFRDKAKLHAVLDNMLIERYGWARD